MKTAKRTELGRAIRWIAHNDEPTISDIGFIQGMISVQLIADIFNISTKTIAEMILKEREEL